MIDYLVVGAGFAGSVCARTLADAGKRVLVIDQRPHVAGNAHDAYDDHGILIHSYGPHIFHTNSDKIFNYLSKFTAWREYSHRVLAEIDGSFLPIPINRTTVNSLYGLNLTVEEMPAFFDSVRVVKEKIISSEDVVMNSVGPDLCEKFFRGYTKKQWGRDLSELSASVAARIPTRYDDDDRYFTDKFQCMPVNGYTAMFAEMLSHENIDVLLNTQYDKKILDLYPGAHLIYSGPIDQYYEYAHGHLDYRSLRFEHGHDSSSDWLQSVGTINYPNNHEYTRITEFKHLTGQVCKGSSYVREYPSETGDPYYPVLTEKTKEIYDAYRSVAEKEKHVSFVGRLAEYRYFNMDQVVGASLKLCERLLT